MKRFFQNEPVLKIIAIVTVVLIVLKLYGVFPFSWWLVFAPLIALIVILGVTALIIILVLSK